MNHVSPKKRHWLRRSSGNRRITPKERRKILFYSFLHTCKRLMFVGLMISLTAVIGIGLYYGYRTMSDSAHFRIKEFAISGNHTLSDDEILAAAGLDEGMSLLAVKPEQVAGRLLKHAWIKDVSCRRIFPNKLVLEVTERHAKAVIYLDRLYLLDEDGEAFAKAEITQAASLPIITGIDKVFYNAHQDEARALINRAMSFMEDFRQAKLKVADQVAEIHVDRQLGLEAELLPGPVRLYLGFDGFAQKLQQAQKAMTVLTQKGKTARLLYLENQRHSGRVVARLAS
jgi:cell division septal protein FtsQ